MKVIFNGRAIRKEPTAISCAEGTVWMRRQSLRPSRIMAITKVKTCEGLPNTSLRTLLSQIYRNTHTIVGDQLRDVILFGSYARGDYDEESDIDIALIIDLAREDMKRFDDDINHMSSEISLDNDVLISIVSIPAREYEYWKNDLPFYRNVAEGVSVVREYLSEVE